MLQQQQQQQHPRVFAVKSALPVVLGTSVTRPPDQPERA
jgi:hypothetical protein